MWMIIFLFVTLSAGFVLSPPWGRADEFGDRYQAYQRHTRAGRAALKKGDYALAIDRYTRAIEVAPFVASHYFDRGLARYKTGNDEKAIEDFDKAIILDARRTSAYVYRGLCRMNRGEYPLALSDYTTALSRNPRDPTVHNNLAWLYATAKDEKYRDKSKALEHARKAADLSREKNAQVMDTLAKAYFINGKVEESIEAEKKAMRLDAKNGAFKEHLHEYEQAVTKPGSP